MPSASLAFSLPDEQQFCFYQLPVSLTGDSIASRYTDKFIGTRVALPSHPLAYTRNTVPLKVSESIKQRFPFTLGVVSMFPAKIQEVIWKWLFPQSLRSPCSGSIDSSHKGVSKSKTEVGRESVTKTTQAHARAHTLTHTHTCTHMHMHTHAYTHMHMRTQRERERDAGWEGESKRRRSRFFSELGIFHLQRICFDNFYIWNFTRGHTES